MFKKCIFIVFLNSIWWKHYEGGLLGRKLKPWLFAVYSMYWACYLHLQPFSHWIFIVLFNSFQQAYRCAVLNTCCFILTMKDYESMNSKKQSAALSSSHNQYCRRWSKYRQLQNYQAGIHQYFIFFIFYN